MSEAVKSLQYKFNLNVECGLVLQQLVLLTLYFVHFATFDAIVHVMNLNLCQLRMEDMIKRSFGEFHTQKDTARNAERLKEIESQLKNLPPMNDYSGDLQSYYDSCDEYFQLHRSIQVIIKFHFAVQSIYIHLS